LFHLLIGGKENFENSDDEDDKNDDDDENSDGVCPYQDFVRLTSHEGMVCRLPDTSQHHDTSRGQDGGSGGSGCQSRYITEQDHGKEEGALDSWNTSNAVDSSDCSSSGHQTHINICPIQSTSSDNTGFQLLQVSKLRTP
jgi:hypothetical protein